MDYASKGRLARHNPRRQKMNMLDTANAILPRCMFPSSRCFFFLRPGTQSGQWVPRMFAAIFCCHYLYRGWIFPSLIRVRGPSNFGVLTAFGACLRDVSHGRARPQNLVAGASVGDIS